MSERTVKQIIDGQQPVVAKPDMSVKDAALLMREHNIGALMICEDAKLVGMFTERDGLFRVIAQGLDCMTTPVSAVMTPHPETIAPDIPFTAALQVMQEGHFRHLPVVDGGRVVGMVSVRDALGPELESVVYEMLRQEQVQEVLA